MRVRVVVVGCGFGGVEVAGELRRRAAARGKRKELELEVLMLDRRARFEYLAALPEILSGKVTGGEISADLSRFAAKIGAEFVNEEVVNINFAAKTVETKGKRAEAGEGVGEGAGRQIPYDFLVLSVGAEQTFFGIPGAEERSHSVNSLKGAVETKNALDRLKLKGSKKVRVVVVGAGLTGVEVAGELVDYFEGVAAEIFLVEAAPRILPAFPSANLARRVAKFLSGRGVEILTGEEAQEVSEKEVTFRDGSKRHYDLLLWTAGVKPNRLLERLELQKEKGWLKVDSCLRVAGGGVKNVFAVGDAVWFERGGLRSGQNVEEAERQGRVAAANIVRAVRGRGKGGREGGGEKLKPYKPKNTTQNPRAFISLGGDKAVIFFRGLAFGVVAYRLKKFVERRYLRRFK